MQSQTMNTAFGKFSDRNFSGAAVQGPRGLAKLAAGMMAGAAVSIVIPWTELDANFPGLRYSLLVGVCSGSVLLGAAPKSQGGRTICGASCAALGGLLMAAAQRLAPTPLSPVLVAAGATLLTCGLAVLFRTIHSVQPLDNHQDQRNAAASLPEALNAESLEEPERDQALCTRGSSSLALAVRGDGVPGQAAIEHTSKSVAS